MSALALQTVALVGRPNVGKSRLFNRLAGRRIAIVHDQAGVTRDVNAVEIGQHYTLLDTGGIGLQVDMTEKEMIEAAEEQVFVAVEAADLICFVVDGREGITTLDAAIADRLRQGGKTVLLVVNKIDAPEMETRADEFAALGFGEMVYVSAEHGYNQEALQNAIEAVVGPAPEIVANEEVAELEERRIRICFAGRPNVGKSSLCNRLLDANRLVVSEISGTTRDAVELDLDYNLPNRDETWRFRLVDTAGVRKRSRQQSSVEYFSSLRSREAIEQSDVVFLVLDALDGVTKQDKTFLGEILEMGKACIVLVNKWDKALETFEREPLRGYETEEQFRGAFRKAIEKEFFFLPKSPILFVSAQTGFAIEGILQSARDLDKRCELTLPTGKLNRVIGALVDRQEPRHIRGKRFKIYYAVHRKQRPHTIRMYCNRAWRLDDGYRRYLQNSLIEEFRLQGCPLVLELWGKPARTPAPR